MLPDIFEIIDHEYSHEVICRNTGRVKGRWIVPTRATAEALVLFGSSVYSADGLLLHELFEQWRVREPVPTR